MSFLEEMLFLSYIMLCLTPLLIFASVGIWYYIYNENKKKKEPEQ